MVSRVPQKGPHFDPFHQKKPASHLTAKPAHIELVQKLREFVATHDIHSNKANAYVEVMTELHRLVVDSIELPDSAKTELKQLLAKRLRLTPFLLESNARNEISPSHAKKIFTDLLNQLAAHKELLSQLLDESDFVEIPILLKQQVAVAEIAERLSSKAKAGAVLKLGDIEKHLLKLSGAVNGMLIMHNLGGKWPEFLELTSYALGNYVAKNFPMV